MIDAPSLPGISPARQLAIAVFGSIGAVTVGIVVALVTSTEAGGVIGVAGVAAALILALRGLPVLDYVTSIDALPAAAILLFLLGGMIPASLGINVAPGVSIDDVPTIVAVVMTLWWFVATRRHFVLPRVAIPLILLVVWLVVSWLVVNPSLRVLLIGPGRWTMYAVMVIAAASWFKNDKLRWWFLGVLIGLAAGQALISIWAYHSNWLLDGYFIGIERFRWYQPLSGVVNGRTTGLLGISSNFFGAFTLIPAFASLGIAVYSRQIWVKTSMTALFGVIAYSGILSYTRATLLGLVLGVVGYLIFARPYRLAPAIVAITVLAILATPIVSRFAEGDDRGALASQAGSTIFNNPFAGVGSGEYLDGIEGQEGFDPDNPTVTPHNSFLLLASETGIPGGALLVIAVLTVLAATWGGSIRRRAGPGVLATAIFAGLGAVLIQTMSNNLLHIPPVATQFWLAAMVGGSFAAAAGGRWATYLMGSAFSVRST